MTNRAAHLSAVSSGLVRHSTPFATVALHYPYEITVACGIKQLAGRSVDIGDVRERQLVHSE